ncbi:MAG: aspartate aminotransferase family protein [Firmicutes bacterium]|nr:aspartate aminotransferase family protein [Bacillota bacterium]
MTNETLTKPTKREYLRETEIKYKEYISPSLARLLKFSGYGTVEMKAEGCYVEDPGGEKYLDCAGGYGVFSLGHRHPRVIAAVKDQLDKIALSAKVFYNRLMADLAEQLAIITPGNLKYTFFCNSGAEAVEGAIKLARLKTGRTKIVAADNAFHGKTLGALSATGRDLLKKPFSPLLPEVIHVPFGDIEALETAVDEHTAAVIMEPVQGEGGIMVAPGGYLQAVRQICDKHNALFIADEVQTGFGRTGKMFAVEHWNVVPDILCLAKALGGGVMPIGAFVGTPEVWEAFKENPIIHTTTFGGNELACRAGLETIKVLQEENLVENSNKMGELLKSGLEEIKNKFPNIVAEVRGMGLMIGVELAQEKFGGSVIMEMAKRRVIGVYTLNKPKVIRFEPPLIITEEEVKMCLDAFLEAAEATAHRLG